MSGVLNRNLLLLKNIIVDHPPCHVNVQTPALDTLTLTIFGTEGSSFQLDLEKTSKTTWEHSDVVEIRLLTDRLSVIAQSRHARTLGRVTFTQRDWASGNCLKRDFETGEVGFKLSLSVHISKPDQIPDSYPTVLRTSDLAHKDDDSLKADILNLCGHQLFQTFKTTQDEEVCKMIVAYKDAAILLSLDDPNLLGGFLMDLSIGYQERYDRFGQTEDLQEAITTGQIAMTHMEEKNEEFPVLLTNVGNSFLCRFEHTAEIDDISEAIRHHQRAVDLTPDGHADLTARYSTLAYDFSDRFECGGDSLDDISQAINNHQRAVDLTPDGHAALPTRLTDLGIAYATRFKRTGNLDDIAEAIRIQQRAVQITPDGHDQLPARLSSLGDTLKLRFERTGALDNISEAIQNQERAVQLTPDGHDELPVRLSSLGNAFRHRCEFTGHLDDISDAIGNLQRAVQLTPEGHSHLAPRLTNLGIALFHRFERLGDMDDISEAIQDQQRAIQLTPGDHTDLPTRLGSLGNSLSIRFLSTGEVDDISEAIRIQQRAIQLTPDEDGRLSDRLTNLGVAFLCRFEHSGEVDDVDDSIKNHQRAHQLTPDGHPRLPARLTNLGNAFFRRYERTGNLDDISEAIRNHQYVVQSTPDGHADLSARFSNLGNAFSARFERNGDLGDISESIRNHQRAVHLTPDGHSHLPTRISNLGVASMIRFEHTGDEDDIYEAFQNQKRAVELTLDGDADLPARLTNLGNAFRHRFKCDGHLDDISQAITNYQRAIELTPDRHSHLPARLGNLGIAFGIRFGVSEDVDDISEAVKNHQTAVQLTPDGHADLPARLNSLGNAYEIRFISTENLDDISEAIKCQQRAIQLTPDGHAELPIRLIDLGDAFSRRFDQTGSYEFLSNALSNYRLSATSSTGPPSVRLNAAKKWADASRRPPVSSSQLLDAHEMIIHLLSLVSGLQNTIQRRHDILRNSSKLPLAACAAALDLGRPDKALEWIVEGRCIVWNQINQLRTPIEDLQSHDRVLAQRLSTVSRELENAGSRTVSRKAETGFSMNDKVSLENQAGDHIKLAKEWDQLLVTIRNISGLEDFLRPKKCADIMRRLPDEGPIVIINMDKDRCDALALRAGESGPVRIRLPDFRYQEAERLAKGLRRYLLRCGVLSRVGFLLQVDDSPIVGLPEVLKVLWSDVVKPILNALALPVTDFELLGSTARLPRIWWCPTGPLAFLPIHAAGAYIQGRALPNECLSSFAVSSYIPTVNSLLKTSVSNSAEKHCDIRNGMSIVSQPNTPGQQPILFAEVEAKRIITLLEGRGIPFISLEDQKGTVDNVLKAMESLPCLHLACHASQNMTNPRKSSIFLQDGQLDIAEMMKRNLPHSDFAFLSACQTSAGDEALSEEVVHIAAGMIAAGYRSVVGTMWSIYDVHGPDLAEFFYESLLDSAMTKGPEMDGAGAARALYCATRRLQKTLPTSPDSLLAWVSYIHIGI